MRRLLYVEPESDGHHLALYARPIWDHLVGQGWGIIWLTSRKAAYSDIGIELSNRFKESLRIEFGDFGGIPSTGHDPLAWFKYQLRHLRILKRELPRLERAYGFDSALMPWLNYCDRLAGILGLPKGRAPIIAIHMHLAFQENEGEDVSLLRRASRALTRYSVRRLYVDPRLKAIGVIIESFVEFAVASRIPGWEKIRYIPDAGVVEGSHGITQSRAALGIRQDAKVILLYGALTRRKGIAELLRGLAALAPRIDVLVILAGKQDAEARSLIDSFIRGNPELMNRILTRDAFIPSAEECLYFAASDVVWVGYPNFSGSSGVLTQAGCVSRPVLAGSDGEIGHAVRKYECGVTCDLADSAAICKSLEALLSNPELALRMGRNGRTRALAHSPEGFAREIYEMIVSVLPNTDGKNAIGGETKATPGKCAN